MFDNNRRMLGLCRYRVFDNNRHMLCGYRVLDNNRQMLGTCRAVCLTTIVECLVYVNTMCLTTIGKCLVHVDAVF